MSSAGPPFLWNRAANDDRSRIDGVANVTAKKGERLTFRESARGRAYWATAGERIVMGALIRIEETNRPWWAFWRPRLLVYHSRQSK